MYITNSKAIGRIKKVVIIEAKEVIEGVIIVAKMADHLVVKVAKMRIPNETKSKFKPPKK